METTQALINGAKNTHDFPRDEGYGRSAPRGLPYYDFGVVLYQQMTTGPGQ